MEQVNDQRFDVEAQHAAEAIAIYKAVTGKGEEAYSREKSTAKWESAAMAASVARSKHPHSAVQTLSQIGAVAACFGRDWPEVPGEPEILRRVKWAARQLQAARALPAGMEPVARIRQGATANIEWRKGMTYADLPAIDGQDLYTAAQVLAMLDAGIPGNKLPPGWQAVPVEPTVEQINAAHAKGFFRQLAIPLYDTMLAAAPRPPAAPTTCGAPDAMSQALPAMYGGGTATTGAHAPTTGAVQPHEQLTDAEIIHALETRRRQSDFYQSRIGLACTQCTDGKYRADSNGYNAFHRCDKCLHVPMWMVDSTELVAPIK